MDEDNQVVDDGLVKVFYYELHTQMKNARIAAAHVQYLFDSENYSVDMFWYHVESHVKALVAMANILWTTNSRNPYKRRSQLLRERFGLTEHAPPNDLRDTRNWFEHFDEKIDDWWDESALRNFADRNITPQFAMTGWDSSDTARQFDPTTGNLSVFGRSVNMRSMHAEMERLMQKITASVRNIPSLHYLFDN